MPSQELADSLGIPFMETSASAPSNVDETFLTLVKSVQSGRSSAPTDTQIVQNSETINDVSDSRHQVGDRVMARYKGKAKYYPGVITRSRLGGKAFDIDYDNGDHEMGVRRELIKAVEDDPKKDSSRGRKKNVETPAASVEAATSAFMFMVGDRVETRQTRVKRKSDKASYLLGVVTAVNANGTCDIDYDNGTRGSSVNPELMRLVERPQGPVSAAPVDITASIQKALAKGRKEWGRSKIMIVGTLYKSVF